MLRTFAPAQEGKELEMEPAYKHWIVPLQEIWQAGSNLSGVGASRFLMVLTRPEDSE